MEEKERYELFGEHCIKDNDTNARCQLLNTYQICVILNEQDKENQQLKQQLETFAHRISDQNEEILELKQQLHDLPKKIVGEIRTEIEFPLYVHPDFDEFECLFDIDKLLDAILKKYGGEDE